MTLYRTFLSEITCVSIEILLYSASVMTLARRFRYV